MALMSQNEDETTQILQKLVIVFLKHSAKPYACS